MTTSSTCSSVTLAATLTKTLPLALMREELRAARAERDAA
jgi:hypothetical protein